MIALLQNSNKSSFVLTFLITLLIAFFRNFAFLLKCLAKKKISFLLKKVIKIRQANSNGKEKRRCLIHDGDMVIKKPCEDVGL